jgi:hypothetical protein
MDLGDSKPEKKANRHRLLTRPGQARAASLEELQDLPFHCAAPDGGSPIPKGLDPPPGGAHKNYE